MYVFLTADQTGTVTSTGGHMFLKFISNGFMERRGFHLEYTFEGWFTVSIIITILVRK